MCKINYQVGRYNSCKDCINDCGYSPNVIKYYYRPVSNKAQVFIHDIKIVMLIMVKQS